LAQVLPCTSEIVVCCVRAAEEGAKAFEGRGCARRGDRNPIFMFVRAGARTGEELMNRRTTSMLAGAVIAASPAIAADVTPERLVNADREPQNWLMNHRTYDSQRYSPLDKINKANVKSLKIAYAVAIGGTSANENLEATAASNMLQS